VLETHSPIKQSPKILRPIGMDFPDAIRLVIAGSRITKLEWDNPEIYGVLKDGFLIIHNKTGDHRWTVSEADLIGLDWVLVPYLPTEN